MEELRKAINHYQQYMTAEQEKHTTDIDEIINGDDNAPHGDWTDAELHAFKYALHRSGICMEALKILEEEKIAESFK